MKYFNTIRSKAEFQDRQFEQRKIQKKKIIINMSSVYISIQQLKVLQIHSFRWE